MLAEILLGCCLGAVTILWVISMFRTRHFKKEAREWESASMAWKRTAEKWQANSEGWEDISHQWKNNYLESKQNYYKAMEVIDQQDKWLKAKIRGM